MKIKKLGYYYMIGNKERILIRSNLDYIQVKNHHQKTAQSILNTYMYRSCAWKLTKKQKEYVKLILMGVPIAKVLRIYKNDHSIKKDNIDIKIESR